MAGVATKYSLAFGRAVGELCAAQQLLLIMPVHLPHTSTCAARTHTHTRTRTHTGLGLEVWKDDSLRFKASATSPSTDVEAGSTPQRPAGPKPRRTAGATLSSLSGPATSAAGRVLGVLPLRVWLIGAYLLLLHVAVMISFTSRGDISKLCACGTPVGVAVAHGDKILPG